MLEKLNTALIEAIQTHVPTHSNPAAVLSDTLFLGREAAYRRLRGEVPFTFGEAAMLGSRLHFSLDKTANSIEAGRMLFKLKFVEFDAPLKAYGDLLAQDIRFFQEAASDPTAIFGMAGNIIPAEMYLRYETMANFKLYKWLHQHNLTSSSMLTFEQMQPPEELLHSYREYVAASQLASTTYYVFEGSGLRHWVNAIRAYHAMDLISRESIARLKSELAEFLDYLEALSISGAYPNGNKVYLYLSDVDMEATYYYVETQRVKAAGIGIFSLNALWTTDVQMYEYAKRWIQTQSRFSTLITRSGEMRRVRFFRRQREILSELN